MPNIIAYHGTVHNFDAFDMSKCAGGIHLGTLEQALTRCDNQGYVLQIQLSCHQLRRSKDMGGGWKRKMACAQSQKCDAIVYLNRYEGLDLDHLQKYTSARLDTMSDDLFKKSLPQATDSWIAFDPTQITILQKIPASHARLHFS